MSRPIPTHEHEMALRERYASTVRGTFEAYKAQQHLASIKVRWDESLVQALAVKMADAHLRGEGFDLLDDESPNV